MLLADNMRYIVANNTTLTNTVYTIQKENLMLCDKINSLINKLAAETGKEAPATKKTYTSPWKGTCNPKKMGEGWVLLGARIWPQP